ncbi:MAG: FAD-binding oxidoreductase [Succinivibrionaceae bacterium]|nr:FAD-binding oxidoreductase [Succinivibrionaceae bacterium]
MIPQLSEQASVDELYRNFFSTLSGEGFQGDIETGFSSRLAVATDNSVYQWLPQGVAFPKSTRDVQLINSVSSRDEFKAVKLVPRGGGTGTNGQSLNGGVVVDLSRHMNVILSYDRSGATARVQPGVVKDQLNDYLRPSGFFFAPELSTSNRATIGGMISTDASGQGSLVYGKTSQHVASVTVALSDGSLAEFHPVSGDELKRKLELANLEGDIYRAVYDVVTRRHEDIEKTFPKLTRFLTGYDLKHVYDADTGVLDLSRLICGSEGTLGFIVEATLTLTRIPTFRGLVTVKYDSFDSALRNAQVMLSSGCLSVETVDSKVLNLARTDIVWYSVKDLIADVPGADMQGINIVEFAGYDPDAQRKLMEDLCTALDRQITAHEAGVIGYQSTTDLPSIQSIYAMRKKAVGLLGKAEGDAKPIAFTEDTCVPPEHLADYILEFRALLDSKGLTYGMFGHVDSGVLHVRPALDMCDPQQEEMLHEITGKMVELTARYGGLMWGEHGRGFRSQYGPKYFGTLFDELRRIKGAFDPCNKINPGKICTPLESDEPLVQVAFQKRGTFDRQIRPEVRHSYGEIMICNGNGACFNYDAGSPMCPSYRLFRDRRLSPKGRASLAREWLRQMEQAGCDLATEEALDRPFSFREVFQRCLNTMRKKLGNYDFSNEVMDALGQCLACKACSSQCPVKVDIANFRSRFMYMYHRRYLRPARDYCVANVERMLPLMSYLPRISNLVMNNPLSRAAARYGLGMVDLPALSYPSLSSIAEDLEVPAFNLEAVKLMDPEHRARSVFIVQDPFTSCYDAPVLRDLLKLVKLLGYTPYLLPFRPNGKVQHVRGFLGAFARSAMDTADFLNELDRIGVPMVGIDPAMVICYRDEYKKVLGDNRGDFNVLMVQEWLLSVMEHRESVNEFLCDETFYLLAHCQEKTFKPSTHNDWARIFDFFGLKLKPVAVGCCGMAGMYGHERIHRQDSERIYNQSFGVAVKRYGVEHCVITGYSCRSQVKRLEGKTPNHPVQIIARYLGEHLA